MNTYDQVYREYLLTGDINVKKFTESQLQEVFDAAPVGSEFEQALQNALSFLML